MDEQAKQLKAAHQIVIEAIGRIVSLYGLPCPLGRTYALLYLADAPLSVAEIPPRLGVTKGTATVNIRMLECLQLVRQVWQFGRRGKFYVAERDHRRALGDLVWPAAAAELANVTASLGESERLLRAVEAGPDAALCERARSGREKIAVLHEHCDASYRLLSSVAAGGDRARVRQPGESY